MARNWPCRYLSEHHGSKEPPLLGALGSRMDRRELLLAPGDFGDSGRGQRSLTLSG